MKEIAIAFLEEEVARKKQTLRGWVISGRDDVDGIIADLAKTIYSLEWAIESLHASGDLNPKTVSMLVSRHIESYQ